MDLINIFQRKHRKLHSSAVAARLFVCENISLLFAVGKYGPSSAPSGTGWGWEFSKEKSVGFPFRCHRRYPLLSQRARPLQGGGGGVCDFPFMNRLYRDTTSAYFSEGRNFAF